MLWWLGVLMPTCMHAFMQTLVWEKLLATNQLLSALWKSNMSRCCLLVQLSQQRAKQLVKCLLSVYNEITTALCHTDPHTLVATVQGKTVSVRCLFVTLWIRTDWNSHWSSGFIGIDTNTMTEWMLMPEGWVELTTTNVCANIYELYLLHLHARNSLITYK